MQFTFYSFLMAVITSSLMIIVIYFLKKTKFFCNAFGVYMMVLLYVLSLVRMLVPVEFTSVCAVIYDPYVLAPVMDFLENRSPVTAPLPFPALYILASAMVLVAMIKLVHFYVKHTKFQRGVRKLQDFSTRRERDIMRKVSKETFFVDHKVSLIKTDKVTFPIVTGVLRNVVLLPNCDYSDKELELILKHECTHLLNNDLWLKALIHIYCCLFWWNPLSLLLKADIDFILELKCDNNVYAKLDSMSRLDYAKAVNDCAIRAKKSKGSLKAASVFSAFARKDANKLHAYRLNNLLKIGNYKYENVLPATLMSIMLVSMFVLSYFVVVHPYY